MAANNEVVREGGQPGRQLPEVEALLPRKDSEGWGDARTRCRRTHSSRRRFRLPLAIARLRLLALRLRLRVRLLRLPADLGWGAQSGRRGRRRRWGAAKFVACGHIAITISTSRLRLRRLPFGSISNLRYKPRVG